MHIQQDSRRPAAQPEAGFFTSSNSETAGSELRCDLQAVETQAAHPIIGKMAKNLSSF
jgi:hypothetical protein